MPSERWMPLHLIRTPRFVLCSAHQSAQCRSAKRRAGACQIGNSGRGGSGSSGGSVPSEGELEEGRSAFFYHSHAQPCAALGLGRLARGGCRCCCCCGGDPGGSPVVREQASAGRDRVARRPQRRPPPRLARLRGLVVAADRHGPARRGSRRTRTRARRPGSDGDATARGRRGHHLSATAGAVLQRRPRRQRRRRRRGLFAALQNGWLPGARAEGISALCSRRSAAQPHPLL